MSIYSSKQAEGHQQHQEGKQQHDPCFRTVTPERLLWNVLVDVFIIYNLDDECLLKYRKENDYPTKLVG